MTIRWLFSRQIRQATEVNKHVRKLLNAQRDIISSQAADAVAGAIEETGRVIAGNAGKAALESQMERLEKTANQHLKPYPHADWRENVEVFLVAIAVAMAIRTFFLQPFKIPTGSMQPTLFGITLDNLVGHPGIPVPGLLGRIKDYCVHGISYHVLIAKADGEVVDVPPKTSWLHFINLQRIVLHYDGAGDQTETETLWFAPEDRFREHAGLRPGVPFKKGDYIVKLRETTGDHLFVDRVTYNFRHPRRGEIIVFQTKGIQPLPQDQFYIKRLVATGGETVQIGADHHLIINGQRLDAATPHFENVYSFTGPPAKDIYSGHVNYGMLDPNAFSVPLFSTNQTFQVRPHHYLVMGDNTMNSFDSRAWGDFPEGNVIGKSFFIYWPLSNHGNGRFGWGVR